MNKKKKKKQSSATIILECEDKLVDDLIKIVGKYKEMQRTERIKYYWEIGKRVNDEVGNPLIVSEETIKKSRGKGMKDEDSITSIVERCREKGIRITRWDLIQARRLASKYDLKEIIKESDITWSRLRKQISEEFMKDKKDTQEKSPFNKFVLQKFRKWNSFVNDFYKAMVEVDFTKASEEEKQDCVSVLKDNIKKWEKRIKQIENGEI